MAARAGEPAVDGPPSRRRLVIAGLLALLCLVVLVVTGTSLAQRWASDGDEETVTVAEPYVLEGAEGHKAYGVWVVRADGTREQVPSDRLHDEAKQGSTLLVRVAPGGARTIVAFRTPEGSWEEVRGTSALIFFAFAIALAGLVATGRTLLRARRRRAPL